VGEEEELWKHDDIEEVCFGNIHDLFHPQNCSSCTFPVRNNKQKIYLANSSGYHNIPLGDIQTDLDAWKMSLKHYHNNEIVKLS